MSKKVSIGRDNEFLLSLKSITKEIFESVPNHNKTTQINPKARREELLKKIENIILKTVRKAAASEVPSVLLKRRRSQWKDCNFNGRLSLRERQESDLVEIKYTTDKKRFEIIFYLLSKIYRLLQTESLMTKRELYYEQTEIFGSQLTVNAALSDICYLLSASPWELRVLSTSKGLVAGALTLTTADCEILNCSTQGGVLVPQDVKGIKKIKSSANFILVVEKDAAFQKLLDDEAHLRLGPCIFITGKGEPDVNTRLLVHRLCKELAIPVLCLVDADPFGIEIMCTYRYGSLALCEHSEHLAVSELRWVGIHPTDIEVLSIPTAMLTERDKAKARDLTSRPYVLQNQQLLEQVNFLLERGEKCEIENLTALSPTFLTDMLLPFKITSSEII